MNYTLDMNIPYSKEPTKYYKRGDYEIYKLEAGCRWYYYIYHCHEWNYLCSDGPSLMIEARYDNMIEISEEEVFCEIL